MYIYIIIATLLTILNKSTSCCLWDCILDLWIINEWMNGWMNEWMKDFIGSNEFYTLRHRFYTFIPKMY
jgi:hypothetical protein